MQLNKTFLLTAKASDTKGSMLIVIDSLEDFVRMAKEYHAKKWAFMLEQVPEWFNPQSKVPRQKTLDRYREFSDKFVCENNRKPFNFEFSTGWACIKSDKGEGFFYDSLKITTDSEQDDCWLVLKEFLSNLPTGTHYCGDYQA